ncbi:MAG: riboflavin synthase [Spirochaetales bacterium]|nr:riboflavin synthase [Spirochaetales bacterium]
MFTGLVQEVGKVLNRVNLHNAVRLTISASKVIQNCNTGDSIAINGVCQTVTLFDKTSFSVDVLSESLRKTNLKTLKIGSIVNLESSLTVGDKIGGHFVLGHVQDTGTVVKIIKSGINTFLEIKVSKNLMEYMLAEGSVCIDGLSLTISRIYFDSIQINIIPHTLLNTKVANYKVGDLVNIEPDILIKGIKNNHQSSLTVEKLLSWGY